MLFKNIPSVRAGTYATVNRKECVLLCCEGRSGKDSGSLFVSWVAVPWPGRGPRAAPGRSRVGSAHVLLGRLKNKLG